MKVGVSECVIRGGYSKIARDLEEVEFSYEPEITVSQRAPCCLQYNWTYPKKEGWIEFEGETVDFIEKEKPLEVWIKTATFGGRGRKWYRNLKPTK